MGVEVVAAQTILTSARQSVHNSWTQYAPACTFSSSSCSGCCCIATGGGPMIPEIAHHMALLPLLWLAVLWMVEQKRDPALWWLSGAFAVSWIADTAAHWVNPWLISAVYPVSQAAIVAAVLLKRDDALVFLFSITVIGIISITFQELQQPNVLRSASWAAIVGIVYPLPLGRLRSALMVTFGIGLAAWILYAAFPGWPTWIAYQGVRATGIVLFCWAAAFSRARLTLVPVRP